MTENHIVHQLHEIAKLTADPEVQRELMQEMFVHLGVAFKRQAARR